jgi:3-methyl-2-oxobutanoate hydroxymethyltransferase
MAMSAIKKWNELCRVERGSESEPIAMVTAYDAPTMRFARDAGVDVVLVGDSAATVMLGYESTMSMTKEEMLMLVSAVARESRDTPVIADMVWGSYHVSPQEAVAHAIDLVRAGAHAVKLEGGTNRVDVITAIVNAEIPVVGHVGLTPQSILDMGSYSVQGKDLENAQQVVADARAVVEAGVSMLVVECVPDALSRTITEAVDVPVIGIGAGRHVEGQVLVMHDILGVGDEGAKQPKFVRRYLDGEKLNREAVSKFVSDVRSGAFPSSNETYHMADDVVEELHLYNSRHEVSKNPASTL